MHPERRLAYESNAPPSGATAWVDKRMTDGEPQEPFVKLPFEVLDLVAAGKLTMQAGWLYALMMTHLNYKRADRKVWPSRRSLAERMRFKNIRAVDRYITELVEAKLIERERRCDDVKVNDTNMYTLLLVCETKEPEGVVSASTLPSAPQNTRGSALENTRVVSHSAPELEELQLDEEQLDQRSLSPGHEPTVAASSVQTPQPREREVGFSDEKFPSGDHRILAKYGWRGTDANKLIEQLTERFDIWGPGWMIAADKNGTLPERIQEIVDERLDEMPDWTGPRPTNGRWPAQPLPSKTGGTR